MATSNYYCRTLNYSGAAVERCMKILDYWEPGMQSADLYARMLNVGHEAAFTASSLKHAVGEVFKIRFLSQEALLWTQALKETRKALSTAVIEQICFLLTARAEAMLYDFMIMEYWPRIGLGEQTITLETLRAFLSQAAQEGRGGGKWTESRFRRATSSLSAACHGFRVVQRDGTLWRLTPPVLFNEVALLLVYDLKNQGLYGSAILEHTDWKLFGLSAQAVRKILSSSAFAPYFQVNESLSETEFSWTVETMLDAVKLYVAR